MAWASKKIGSKRRRYWERLAAPTMQKRAGAAGVMLAAGQGVKRDTKAVAKMLKASCDGGDAIGCVELGKLMLTDKKLNAGDAQFVFRKACYGGEFEGCTWLGNMRQEGLGGMKSSPKIANKFYEKGCKEGSALACYKLGLNTAAGEGTKKNKAMAAKFMERACQAGHEPACGAQ
jgi:TPR repeat protein